MDARASAELRIPSLCLMESAGAGAATIALESSQDADSVVVCVCGPGNNGGDAVVVARHLAVAGRRVCVVRAWEGAATPRGDARTQWEICRALGLRTLDAGDDAGLRALEREWSGAGLVVDGLFGTGLDRAIGGLAASVVAAVNSCGRRVLALDLPSGLDCDSGEPLGSCVRADVTATFAAPKLGFSNPASRAWTGEVRVVGIGAPVTWPPA